MSSNRDGVQVSTTTAFKKINTIQFSDKASVFSESHLRDRNHKIDQQITNCAKSFHVVYPGDYTVTKDMNSITHSCPKMVITESNCPDKFIHEILEP